MLTQGLRRDRCVMRDLPMRFGMTQASDAKDAWRDVLGSSGCACLQGD